MMRLILTYCTATNTADAASDASPVLGTGMPEIIAPLSREETQLLIGAINTALAQIMASRLQRMGPHGEGRSRQPGQGDSVEDLVKKVEDTE